MKKLFLLILMLLAFDFGFGQEIASFSRLNSAGCSGSIYEDSNITTTGICRGPGLLQNGGVTYNSRRWTSTTTLDPTDYLEWTLTANSGYQIDLTTMDIRYDRSGEGPKRAEIQINTGSGFTTIFTDASVSPSGENNNIDLSSFSGITNTITFRIYAYNSDTQGGTFDIEELTVPTDKGIIINGSVILASPCVSTSIWNGSTWSTGTPNLTTEAILDANYDTSSNGNIQACSLTVSSNFDLTITNNTFVEVENDLTVEANANIYVASQGAFVQNDDLGTITYNGTIEVEKVTAPTNNWYEYTYWSSPVVGEDIDGGLTDAKSNRRYLFNAENFLDSTAETNNNNATIAGQDNIDDNGDDWANVSGTTIMEAGIGYASMHDPVGFTGPGSAPYQFSYSFEGAFNNGVISVPIYRNDSENNDINWNFIGNPYPSAIDADLFLAANSNISTSVAGSGYINGAIFLWSQNTLPSATTNGNEPLNFSNDDYSIINASGETTGGDGTTAATLSNSNRAISSGQGFFVAFSDGAIPISTTGDISEGVITFNNSMRVTDVAANSVFFKGTSSKNTNIADKLWINLTSEVGVYNQILIAYVNGATNEDDGLTFDATKYPTNSGAALYSTIGNSNKKFAIQGKAVESINEEEVINLGFTNYINNEIPYTLSIDKLQGDFLNNNTVYLKDNLLNITHNLSDGDYNFTSETGAFTNRFEVVFKEENTLTVDDIINNESAFQIIQHDSDRVTFKTGTSATLKSIAIYDLFGRKVYQFKGGNSSETFNIPNIKTGIYLAKAELSTGVIITKKAIKR
ncbi:T9SS type A sorting domain-containing protein [Algibacter lectus]|uniref:T9SS type A sorting domain-containing protein n=1 Tax=Algibacter lectus TaxID=221126 RepID=UPI001113520B|nr:T9SS type A sorting domain-containing protein [Algibacter lectus]